MRREALFAQKALGEQDGARTRSGCYGAPRFRKGRGLFLMATRALQQSAAVRRVRGKSILRVGVSAASLRLSKSAVPETEKKNKKKKQQHHAFCLLLIQLFITDVYSTFCSLWTLYRMSCDATRPIRNTCGSCQRKVIHIFIQNILLLTIPLMR